MLAFLLAMSAFATPSPMDPPPPAPEPAPRVRLLTFNIRYANTHDGADAWSQRAGQAIDLLKTSDADFIGLQEVLPGQMKEVADGLPRYGSIVRSREKSAAEGEATPIFFNRARWTLVEGSSGTFWLSETPTVAGSKSWKSGCPRIATWGVFRDQKAGGSILVVNTHLDNESQEARANGARLIAEFLAREAGQLPVIVMGDFNAEPPNPCHSTLCEGVNQSPRLEDAYVTVHRGDERESATFHGFKGGSKGPRIDWVLSSAHFRALEAGIDHRNREGRYPSDHYPVTATLEWIEKKSPAKAPEEKPSGADAEPKSPPEAKPPPESKPAPPEPKPPPPPAATPR